MKALAESVRLRQLVSDYYHGLVTQESYREQRARLLDNIGADVDEAPKTVPRKRADPDKHPEEVETPAKPASKPPRSGPKTGVLLIGAIVVVAIVAGIYLMLAQGPDTRKAKDSAADRFPSVEEISTEFGNSLVEEFLNRDDWSVDSLNNFLLAWNALDEKQRQRSIEGRLYRRLRVTLHRRIREQELLSDAVSNGNLQALTNFATRIGAPYRASKTLADEVPLAAEPSSVVDTRQEPAEEPAASNETATATPPDASESTEPEPEQEARTSPPETASPVAEASDPEPVSASVTAPAAGEDSCPASLASTRRPYCRDVLDDGSDGPPLVILPQGSFQMGSTRTEVESPQHQVDIAYHVAMSRYEITAAEYQQFCNAASLPCADQVWGDEAPVVSVSWDDAMMYTQWLTQSTGHKYRLPTEAEWEYAARGGTQSPYFFGDEITPAAAHSAANGPAEAPLPRGDRSINRNPFRLYHMSGNVREWTEDSWYPTYAGAPADGAARTSDDSDEKVVRGGSYTEPGTKLRSAAREPLDRSHRDKMTGFRVVREVAPDN